MDQVSAPTASNAGLSSETAASTARENTFDSYDDDLLWILEKLIARAGATFGVISRYQLGNEEAAILARGGSAPSSSDQFAAEVTSAARSGVKFDRRRREDVENMTHYSLQSRDAENPNAAWTLLCLYFFPTQNVCIVATICKPGDVPFSASQGMVAATLYPVLARYIRLWWLHRTERRRANALTAALDLSDIGIMMLNRRAELLFANTKATALLQRADGLERIDQFIAAKEFADGARFQAAIQHAINGNSAGRCAFACSTQSRAPGHAPILSLRRNEGKRALIATVMSVDRVAIDAQDPAVIVYVLDPDQDVERLLLPVCHIYRLTASETRLVHYLVSGFSLGEAAAKMKIQIHTARAYLKQVFLKTRTKRQADLVRVMLSSLLRTNSRIDLALV